MDVDTIIKQGMPDWARLKSIKDLEAGSTQAIVWCASDEQLASHTLAAHRHQIGKPDTYRIKAYGELSTDAAYGFACAMADRYPASNASKISGRAHSKDADSHAAGAGGEAGETGDAGAAASKVSNHNFMVRECTRMNVMHGPDVYLLLYHFLEGEQERTRCVLQECALTPPYSQC